MTQNTRTIVGVLFLIISVTAISLLRINPPTSTPTRSTQTRTASIMKGLVQGVIITQELNVLKDYLSGVELIFTHSGRKNNSENHLLLLDRNKKILYQEKFSSADVKEGDFTAFYFDKPVYIGTGNHLYVCLYSADGTEDNHVSLLFNTADSIGPLSIAKVNDNDPIGSIDTKLYTYQGSLMVKTFGTNYSQFWLMKALLYIMALVFSAVIIWFAQARDLLIRIRIFPEWIFVFIAIPISTIFAFITPPLQVPDEGGHFYKSYKIADLSLFSQQKTVPSSIYKLDTSFNRLRNAAGKKTSFEEITGHLGEKLQPKTRTVVNLPDFILPYLPQAIGIFIGKILGLSPLVLMYLGRIFNLLASVLLMFFAIRIIPQFKWIFLLLALMPKTLFLFGSLSYDSLTISLSFLSIAVFFYYAFACERDLTFKDLAWMGLLVFLLLLCKPPYFIIGLLFFFIPPKKFGSLYKYIMIAVGVAVLAIAIFKVVPAIVSLNAAGTQAQVSAAASNALNENLPVIRPEEQIGSILNDIPAYLGLIVKSGFDHNRSYILESFVGLLGWIDVNLPDALTYSYLVLILLASLAISSEKVSLGVVKKGLLVFILVFSYIAIHTAMYIYATTPGRDQVYGVQGRYFIPVAPFFFMLLYNRYFNPRLNVLFSMRRKEYNNAKIKAKPAILQEINTSERLFDKAFYLFMAAFCLFTLFYSIFISLIRYYNI